jgi:hypothetical protein
MLSGGIVWGLGAGAVFLLAVWLYRNYLSKAAGELRKLSEDASSLLVPLAPKQQTPPEHNADSRPEAQDFSSSEGNTAGQSPEAQEPATTHAVSAGNAIQTVRTLSTGILFVIWPIFTFILPFSAFYPPLLFVYIAYPVIWYYSGIFNKAALTDGRRNLLMASAPLLFLLVIAVAVMLIAGLVAAIQR